ncbi:MAG: tRNA (adenine-N1)-methyltransferase [Actinobacteria bacterium]|nr:tRNA (adenine-N1)-methyltransferase [Actinomycetota bacterium]MCB9412523.1 tRNA (adenine-N1)-methyltransferase [Actinomycetota bacterium]
MSVNPGPAARGPLQPGDRVQLADPKGRLHTVTLERGRLFHTAKGSIAHDDLIGGPEGVVVTSSKGTGYVALRPLLSDFVLSMPRGAAVVYPKDAAMIVGLADVFPSAFVVEAGAGSGALTCSLLRAVGETGRVLSYERRADFAEIAEANVTTFFGRRPSNWTIQVGDFAAADGDGTADRVVLDMLAAWDCLPAAAGWLRPGGVLVVYVATTTQLSRVVETMRDQGCWTEPKASETLVRPWHVEGLSVRPSHRMVGHTGFLVAARRLADGTVLPLRRTRPAKGAYGRDWKRPGESVGDESGGISDPAG